MIVCHCNYISNHDIARACAELAQSQPNVPVTIEAVYEALGKQPRCRSCLELAASFLSFVQTEGNAASTASDDSLHQARTLEDALRSSSSAG